MKVRNQPKLRRVGESNTLPDIWGTFQDHIFHILSVINTGTNVYWMRRSPLVWFMVSISVCFNEPLYIFVSLERKKNSKWVYWRLWTMKGWLWSYVYGSWIYNYLCNTCLSPLTWVQIPFRRSAFDTTLCDEVCQWLLAGQWFSPGTLVSFTNKTYCHDITEILLKVALHPEFYKGSIISVHA